MRFFQVNVEIDPLALWRNFEFLVALDVREIRADECFRDFPVPQFVGFFLRIGIGLQAKLFVRAEEEEVEIVFRPARADFRAVSLDGIAEAVFVDEDGVGFLPEVSGRIEHEANVFLGVRTFDSRDISGESGNDAEKHSQYRFSEASHPNAPLRMNRPASADKPCKRGRSRPFVRGTALRAGQGTSGLPAVAAVAIFRECPGCSRGSGGRDRIWQHWNRSLAERAIAVRPTYCRGMPWLWPSAGLRCWSTPPNARADRRQSECAVC